MGGTSLMKRMLRPDRSLAGVAILGLSLVILLLAAGCASGEGAANLAAAPEEPPGEPDVTYYVVAFHWGWAVFDETGRELDAIRVPQGTTVEIYAVNDAAEEAIGRLPGPVAAAITANDWHGERARREIEAGRLPDPMLTVGLALHELEGHAEDADEHGDEPADDHGDGSTKEHAADDGDAPGRNTLAGALPAWRVPWLGEERSLETHGFLIPWYGVAKKLEPDAAEPAHVVFTADRSGAFQFVCTVYCGYGHSYQPREMLFVGGAAAGGGS